MTARPRPTIFHGVLPADAAARSDALLVARPDLATLTVSGPDRLAWLQGVLTCNVDGLAEGDGRWGLVLSRQGKILSDVLVVAAPDAVHLGVPLRAAPRVHAWLSSFLIMEDAEIDDRSADFVWFIAHGPRGGSVAAQLVARFDGARGAVDPTGLGGATFLVPRAHQLETEVVARDELGVLVATDEDWLRLRVERLVPLYGIDVDEQRNPHEASLDRRSISWDKGCYLGQEAVCMLDMRGKVKRRLVLVALEGDVTPGPGTPVSDAAGTVLGETRTAALSSLFGCGLALALLAEAATVPGTRLTVGGVSAAVVEPNR